MIAIASWSNVVQGSFVAGADDLIIDLYDQTQGRVLNAMFLPHMAMPFAKVNPSPLWRSN